MKKLFEKETSGAEQTKNSDAISKTNLKTDEKGKRRPEERRVGTGVRKVLNCWELPNIQ